MDNIFDGIEYQNYPNYEFRYLVYDAENGDQYFVRNKGDQTTLVNRIIDTNKDDDDGSWLESTTNIFTAKVTGLCREFDRIERPQSEDLDEEECDDTGFHWDDGISHIGDYRIDELND